MQYLQNQIFISYLWKNILSAAIFRTREHISKLLDKKYVSKKKNSVQKAMGINITGPLCKWEKGAHEYTCKHLPEV